MGSLPSSIQERMARQAWSQTYSSRRVMKPFSSKSGMNFMGGTMPCSGSRQRTSASAPTTSPAAKSICG